MGKISDALDKFEQEHKTPERRREKGKSALNGTPEIHKAHFEVEKNLIPSNKLDSNLITIFSPQSFVAEQFRMLRTQLLFPISGNRPRSIMVTSALPGEGKSFISANLAASLAQNINEHVLAIDCDIRRPTVHKCFGLGDGPGLSDYLSGNILLSSLLHGTVVDKLKILPGGSPVKNPAELLSSRKMTDLFHELTSRYGDRYLIIDSPPPKLTSETKVISRHVDGILLVVKYRSTPRKLVADITETLGKEKILGVVFNMCDFKSTSYNYGKYGKYSKYYESGRGKRHPNQKII
jgi:exopolysaccharide/PEP-CTERM locus tyrosine autokinase